MPKIKPRTKAPKQEQLTAALQGELATYEKVGLFQRSELGESSMKMNKLLVGKGALVSMVLLT